MKKIFTLFTASLMALSSWAAVPELLFGDTPVVAGQTYQTGYTTEVIDLGVMKIVTYIQDADLFLKGLLGEEVSVEVKADADVSICSVDGMCVNAQSLTKTGYFGSFGLVSEDGDYGVITLDIHKRTDDMTGAAASTVINNVTLHVKAYYTDTPNEFTETTVILTNKTPEELEGGITDVKNEAAISVGHANTLNFNVAVPTKLDIYNVNGALVMSRTIYQTGSLSLDSLHPGVYIFSAGKTTGKVLVHK